MKKIKIAFLINFIIFVLAIIIVNYFKHAEINYLLKKTYELNKKIFEYDKNILSERADLLYDLLIDKKVLRYVYEANETSRKELIKYLYPKYLIIKRYGIYQFHFHLIPAKSFVRFHRLKYYGDTLGVIRKSVILAQKEKKPIKGFELGRVEGGFRNVYPLIYHNKLIGSVEFSYSLDYFAKKLLKNFKYAFLVNKNSFDNVLFPLIKVNYQTFKNYYILYNNGVKLDSVDFLQNKFVKNDFLYVILPIKDVSNRIIGHLIVQKKSKDLEVINKSFNLYLFFAFSIFLVFNVLLITAYMLLKTKKISDFDELTGIYNRRGCMEKIKKFKTFGVLIFDVDYFKKINDKFGHDVGDNILKEITKVVKSNLRKEDVFCRWGGEEFIIVIENDNLEDLKKIAEKIRKKIEKHIFNVVGKVTVSIGVAVAENFETAFKKADENLYKAKNEGRNRVIF